MFDWEGFENRKFCVDFKNDADKIELLEKCKAKGIEMGCEERYFLNSTNWCINANQRRLMFNSAIENIVIYNPHEIDCSIAVNYKTELKRMCKSFGYSCGTCPLNRDYPVVSLCEPNSEEEPQEAVEIVQKWSDEYPREKVVTLQDKFLELFPNAKLNNGVIAVNRCYLDDKNGDCCSEGSLSCCDCRNEYWSQPYKENTNGE